TRSPRGGAPGGAEARPCEPSLENDSNLPSTLDGIASIDRNGRAGHEVGGGARQEHGHTRHVLLYTPTLGGRTPKDAVVEPSDLLARLARELGVDPAREHRVDLDVVARPTRGHGPGELDDAALGRRVGRREGGAEDGHHGADVDDLAPALPLHHGMAGTAGQKGAGEVGLEDLVPLLEGEALRRLAYVDARVVNEHVETAEAGQGSLDEG